MTDLITAQDRATNNLPQLEVEIKFYLGQTAQNIIEVGKRLTAAKALVQHGHWQPWLNDNFQLSYQSAARFMECADKFANLSTLRDLKPSQMFQLLSLPDAEETEKFIAEKAAEGKRVADMTIKQLREEIADYKKQLDDAHENYQQSLFDLGEKNKAVIDEQEQKFQQQIADLEQELKDRPTVAPDDYQSTKDALIAAKIELGKTQANMQHQAEDFKKQTEQLQNDFAQQNAELQNNLDAARKRISKLTAERDRIRDIQKQMQDLKQRRIEHPDGLFDVIVIDPPWNYGTQFSHSNYRGNTQYPEMTQDELKAIELPAAENCVLFLWTTHKFIWDAKELLDRWGFNYRCMLVWNKQSIGMGGLIRLQCEFCLIGLKGNPTFKDVHNIRDLIEEPRREHSRKPDAFYQIIDELCTGRKLDYFSRTQREGWTTYGNDTAKFSVA